MKEFYKYHSLENDFILFDYLNEEFDLNNVKASVVADLCQRKAGIGADGVLFVTRDADGCFVAYIANADGSIAEVCLNGLRVVAFFLFSQDRNLTEVNIKMYDRIFRCTLDSFLDDRSGIVGEYGALGNYEKRLFLSVQKNDFEINVVNCGNPHAVIFYDIAEKDLVEVGAAISNNYYFKHKTNVEFVTKAPFLEHDQQIFKTFVFERGVGVTRACGSGALAVLTTLLTLQKIDQNETVIIRMPGGDILAKAVNESFVFKAKVHFVFRGFI